MFAGFDAVVDHDGGVDECFFERDYFQVHFFSGVEEVPVHEVAENGVEGVGEIGLDIEEVEVSGGPEGDLVPALAGRPHCGDESHVFQELPLFALQVVPPPLVQLLSDYLQRRLRRVLFLKRHVQVVDEQYHTRFTVLI